MSDRRDMAENASLPTLLQGPPAQPLRNSFHMAAGSALTVVLWVILHVPFLRIRHLYIM